MKNSLAVSTAVRARGPAKAPMIGPATITGDHPLEISGRDSEHCTAYQSQYYPAITSQYESQGSPHSSSDAGTNHCAQEQSCRGGLT